MVAAAAIPRTILRDPPCGRCEHLLSRHCKGNVQHGYHKEDMWPADRRKCTVTCKTRHCENPLCSCIDFVD